MTSKNIEINNAMKKNLKAFRKNPKSNNVQKPA